MIGLLLAGGKGSRLWPITSHTSKQLLPIYDKPMIFYSLSTLMLAGVKRIFLVCTSDYIKNFKALLGDGNQFGLSIEYLIQNEPKGIAHAIELIPNNERKSNLVISLGDNLFYGMGLGTSLQNVYKGSGALAFGYKVSNPEEYGVVCLDEKLVPTKIIEKPVNFVSSWAIPGLYFFDSNVYDYQKMLTPSARNELEITDLLKIYLKLNKLEISVLERGTAWLDTGNPQAILEASEFVRVIEHRQGMKIGCPEEIALRQGFISRGEFSELVQSYPESSYKSYLVSLL
jgi:glucose-1-phosphate thymidylyltransferase